MSQVLAAMAVLAWSLGAAAMPVVGWIWVRARRPRLTLIVFGAILVAEIAWLVRVAAGGIGVLLDPEVSGTGWTEWMLGVAGIASLLSGLRGLGGKGVGLVAPLSDPDSALQVGIGFLGVGYLLRQLALTL
jgi:hypothetical protein